MNPVAPLRLDSARLALEPLHEAHGPLLFAAADDAALFRYLPDRLETLDDHVAFVRRALDEQRQGRALPFAIRLADGTVVGTTRFGAVEWAHRRAEIGWTWIARRVQRSFVNTQCKRLLLGYGFDVLGLNRIEFKTDSLNERSRAAIARLGATQEGVFRNHMVMPDGRVRHTVYFSIVRDEWPAVRQRLDSLLMTSAAPAASHAQV